jgi:ribosomal protein S18 acetylase RimI-like enzyme
MAPSYHQDSGLCKVTFLVRMTKQVAQPAALTFRPASPADSAAVAQAFLASSRSSYTDTAAVKQLPAEWIESQMAGQAKRYGEEYWRDLITQAEAGGSDQLFLVALEPGQDTVSGLMYLKKQNGAVWLDALYLIPDAQGKGLGTKLMERAAAFAGALPLELDVMDANKQAIRFYEKFGFKQVGESFRHQPGAAEVFVMRKESSESKGAHEI